MLMLILIVLPFGHGFLLDNSQVNAGQSLPANQYLTIAKFVEETNLLQQKVETDTTSLRHYTDNSLALLAAQLQQKFDLIDAKITDKEAQNKTNQALVTLQQRYQALEQTYHNLKNENVILQGKLSVVESELLLIKDKTNINDKRLEVQKECCNETQTVLIKQGHELSLLKNKSTAIDQDISSLKQLSSIKPLQQIKILEEKVQTLYSQTTTLSLKEHARSQDFLALYNMTTHSFTDLEMRTDSKIQQLSNQHNISFSDLKNRMYLLNNDTLQSHKTSMIYLERSVEIQLKNTEKNQSEALGDIVSGMQETEKRTNLTLSRLQKQIDDSTDLVVMTAQPVSASTKRGIIRFDDVKFSIGINDLSSYKSTGKFTCETGGIYLISASIMSQTNDAYYHIILNGTTISATNIGYSSSSPLTMHHTGSVVLARQLRPNDSVWVSSNGNNYMFGGMLSTFTIVKVK
ncbi:myosin-11-like [Mytilus edulis]|uniref:myosin-11-like n=1 Tax=Mytilus edulis TaxID=6550 RepID=UPI0039EF0C14